MKIVVEDKEIKIDDLSDLLESHTSDKSKTKITGQGSHKGQGRGEQIDDLTKELIAIDGASRSATQSELASIYGVTQATVSQKSNGMNTSGPDAKIDEDLKQTVDRVTHRIENAAVSKLMSTLDLFNPEGLETQMEVITAAQKLAGVVEKVRGRNKEDKGNNVHLHLYQPRMKAIKDYEVIEVG